MIQIASILFATLTRLVPHYPNVTALGATAIVAGRKTSKSNAIGIVLASLLLSDFFLSKFHFYGMITFVTPFVYSGFIAQAMISSYFRKNHFGALWGILGGSFLFFLISNFGVWASGMLYAKDPSGLLTCYIAAIPFWGYSMVGDFLYTGILLGIIRLVRQTPVYA
jgi:hypothetical protein